MTRRHIPELERLETRETPDVALGSVVGLARAPALPFAATDLTDSQASNLLALPALNRQDLSLEALEAFFANPLDVEPLLTGSEMPTRAARESVGGYQVCGTAAPEGLEFLWNYTRKAIRNEESRFGRLPDHEDIQHQVYLEWREQVGRGDDALADLLVVESGERQVLRKTVRQVLDRTRYQHQRQQRTVELLDQPAPESHTEQEWVDIQIDFDAERPSARERQVFELRRQGMTFEEIGAELGLVKQRVCEIYQDFIGRLQTRYAAACA